MQPEKIKLVRNVNASCQSSTSCTPTTCTRHDWLQGIGCCGGVDVTDCVVATEQGAIARLCGIFADEAGSPIDPINPRISIKDPYNDLYLSNQPMVRQDVGDYVFNFGTDGNTTVGKWTAIVTGVIHGIAVRSEYFFCVLQLGTLPRPDTYCGYGYGYGYGCECYSNIENGAECFGTFAGREECGLDSNVSKDIPSTGGCRTNRNAVGDGFWDGISYEETCVTPIGKRGQCMKDRAVAMTRVRLKDTVPECWAFTEDEIDMQLETSLADFNASPMFTCFTWDTLPEPFLGMVVMGAQVFALFAQGLLEAGREFTITDNGISFTPPQISGHMQTAASTLLSIYVQERDKIKSNLKPHPAGVGTFRVTSLMPQLTRLRHLRAKEII